MTQATTTILDRRTMLRGIAAGTASVGLAGCSTLGGFGWGPIDAIRNLLLLSAERTFAALTEPGGWYDGQIAKLGLANVLGNRGGVLQSILTSGIVKDRLEREFAMIAVEGAERAAPVVYDTVRTIGIGNAIALVTGGRTAATGFLRNNMGQSLIEVMVPEIGDAMRISREPVVGQLLSALSGVDIERTVGNFAREADDAIWNQMGVEEGLIRDNPRLSNDPAIIAVLGAGGGY
ncbi:DUF4197 family protein [Alteriqipengyuania sp. WL0013]|uniref:DUF4197 family protein n=1 Tax=Alteriqipengyuania sp. WL0013 TaxID=3110773 RepID=UPI002B8F5C84|nr:DUF4197 family protein [Alteriqipengyuania sp. WL0013]MEB3415392.1 DUF4197 family protein [Alteriqipengyuania sp. WL0013]